MIVNISYIKIFYIPLTLVKHNNYVYHSTKNLKESHLRVNIKLELKMNTNKRCAK